MRTNKLLIVVHAVNKRQVLENVAIAVQEGAHGVFLINHEISAKALVDVYAKVDQTMGAQYFIGLNFLGIHPLQAIDLLSEAWNSSGIWFDDMECVEGGSERIDNIDTPMKIRGTLKALGYRGLTFAPVDFKYQRAAKNLSRVTETMSHFGDVVTTSGPRTGSPPTLEKIVTMREAVPDVPIAIASGITPENVDPFLDHVDFFLVATGVSHSHTELDPQRVRLMADKMRK